MRVLIVEDDPIIAYNFEEVLRAAGYSIVATVSLIPQALFTIENNAIDIATLDGNLGGESSEPVALALAKRNIPILIVTAYNSGQLGYWARDYHRIEKPCSDSELLNAVAEVLRVG